MLECSESTTLDDFGTGILVNEGSDDYFGLVNGNTKDEVSVRAFERVSSKS